MAAIAHPFVPGEKAQLGAALNEDVNATTDAQIGERMEAQGMVPRGTNTQQAGPQTAPEAPTLTKKAPRTLAPAEAMKSELPAGVMPQGTETQGMYRPERKQEVSNAKQVEETAQPNGNVREQQGAQQGQGQVPAEKGSSRVREGGQEEAVNVYQDPRLKRKWHRGALEQMAGELTPGGGYTTGGRSILAAQ